MQFSVLTFGMFYFVETRHAFKTSYLNCYATTNPSKIASDTDDKLKRKVCLDAIESPWIAKPACSGHSYALIPVPLVEWYILEMCLISIRNKKIELTGLYWGWVSKSTKSFYCVCFTMLFNINCLFIYLKTKFNEENYSWAVCFISSWLEGVNCFHSRGPHLSLSPFIAP